MLKKEKLKFKIKIIYDNYKKNFFVNFLIQIFRLKDIIEFLPKQEDMNQFYQSIDYLVVPSLIEPFGMVATEAMKHYKPVICSSICGCCDFIKENYNGFIANYNSHKERNLFLALQKALYLDEKRYKEMGQSAYESVQFLSLENFVIEYSNLLQHESENI